MIQSKNGFNYLSLSPNMFRKVQLSQYKRLMFVLILVLVMRLMLLRDFRTALLKSCSMLYTTCEELRKLDALLQIACRK